MPVPWFPKNADSILMSSEMPFGLFLFSLTNGIYYQIMLFDYPVQLRSGHKARQVYQI